MTREEAVAELKTRYLTMSQCLGKEELCKANEAIDLAIEALQTERKTDWIPFDDESPDKDDLYLVTWVGDIGKSGGKFRGIEMLEYYDGGKWDTEKIEKRGYRNVRVTAWMELPEPWEEDEE